MSHFRGIEGLRAWLACIVMAHHVIWFSGLSQRFLQLKVFNAFGYYAVSVFIIISGFVIAHLLLERGESYGPYLLRRFLRIYPVYLVCLAAGILTTYLNFHTFLPHPWGAYPATGQMTQQLQSLQGGDWISHLLAHFSMLHGAIPAEVLPESPYMFLAPAWSLSLEWQFYMIAPLVIACMRTQFSRIALACVALILFYAYEKGLFGQFVLPSFLPGAFPYFAVGIGTRLVIGLLPRFSIYPVASLIALCAFFVLDTDLMPFIVWIAFISMMLIDKPKDRLSSAIKSGFDVAFDSKAAKWMGARSYPIYLAHVPVFQLIAFIAVRSFGWGMIETFALAIVLTPVLTIGCAMILHRYVEKPGIILGKSLFQTEPSRLNDKVIADLGRATAYEV
ncbi:MAG: acyltransferase [Rhodocyclales bacterium]|nr:acyltransferase [Rhodocyclales bacterium]